MKKRTILSQAILLLMLLSESVQAQILDSTLIVCQYKAKTIKVTAQKQVEDLIRLEIGRNLSKSYSVYTARSDSFEMSPDYKAQLIEMSKQVTASIKSGIDLDDAIDRSGMLPVRDLVVTYKNYPEGKITVLDRVLNRQYEYEDQLNSQKWKIEADTIHLLGYVCQKATAKWRGRKYEAWFAPEVPFSDGPLKFGGLPGLIFKLEDEKKEYCYELEGIEQKTLPIKMDVPVRQKKFIVTTREKFMKAYRNFLDNFSLTMSEESGIKAGTNAKWKRDKYDFIETDL